MVDAFIGQISGRFLRGNPAAVVLLDDFEGDAQLQEWANEFNLSETAFVVPRGGGNFDLRWFTPQAEVNLCGHATLAATRALQDAGQLNQGESARFATRSGLLTATLRDDPIELDFPAQGCEPCAMPTPLALAFGWDPMQPRFETSYPCFRAGDDWLVVVHHAELENARPDFGALKQLDGRGVILTSVPECPSEECDFLSRFFGPRVGIDEDPVTGSAHTALGPFWRERLGKSNLRAVQLSERGGYIELAVRGARVTIAGKADIRAQGHLWP